MSSPEGAPFNPSRLTDRRRPDGVVDHVVNPEKGGRTVNGLTEIKIFGVGGAGNNALNRMVKAGLSRVEFVGVNSDGQALRRCAASHKIAIGSKTTRNLGAGGDPSLGARAAGESIHVLREALAGADMVFVTAGMGGGTGTGAAPVVAQLARAQGALTVGVVTTPFAFEGTQRRRAAEMGIENMSKHVDALVVISNDRLIGVIDKKTSVDAAFTKADAMLLCGVRGIADLITTVGLVNVDFADVRTIMAGSGTALMGVGSGSGDSRAETALNEALSSPLLEGPIEGATGILANITGGNDMGIHEVESIVGRLRELASPDARIVFGAVIDPRPIQTIMVTLIATGFDGRRSAIRESRPRALQSRPAPAAEPATIARLEQARQRVNSLAGRRPAPEAPPVREAVAEVRQPLLIREIDERLAASFDDMEVPAVIRRRQRRD